MPECARVVRESFRTVAAELGFDEKSAPRFTAWATTADRLRNQYEDERRPMFVWEEGGSIKGYYSLRLLPGGVCELNNLGVLPACRHQGIGASLLRHAFATARGLGCVRMDIGIVEENRRLRAWYEGFGFVHTGTRKFDFFPFACGYLTRSLDRDEEVNSP